LHHDSFYHLGAIPACDGQTQRTDKGPQNYTALAECHVIKMTSKTG